MVLNGVTLDRLGDRKALLSGFDKFPWNVDSSGVMNGLDAFNEQAFGMLTSNRLVGGALGSVEEDPRLLARYGKGDPKPARDVAPRMPEQFLLGEGIGGGGGSRRDGGVWVLGLSREYFPRSETGYAHVRSGTLGAIEDLHLGDWIRM